jgi:hypothetical protein
VDALSKGEPPSTGVYLGPGEANARDEG